MISDPKQISQAFNEYFINTGREILNSINGPGANVIFYEFLTDGSMYFKKTNCTELMTIVDELNKRSATGHDKISVKDILLLEDDLIPILVLLINKSFTEGIFPSVLKYSRVSPIHKGGGKTLLDNYRPISVVSAFSKIIELIFKKRLVEFVKMFVGYDDFQYGFQEQSGTLSATMDFVDYVSSALDEGNYAVAILIDLRKAFDVVDHTILLKKLQEMGIRGKAFTFVKSYIENREQYTQVNGISSTTLQTNCGVPQGSVLGPILFSLHIRSLQLAGLLGRYFLYADDMLLVYKHKNIHNLEAIINNDLALYHQWITTNKLKINTKKTTYIVFAQKNTNPSNMCIRIGGDRINRVHSAKYLGLILDERLTWGNHLGHIEDKIIPMVGALYRCRDYLSRAFLYQIYNAYFLSVFRYLITVWGTCGGTTFIKAQRLQNKVVKVLFGLNWRTPTDTVYSVTKISKLSEILKQEQSKFMFKVVTDSIKCNIPTRFINEIHNHCTRNQNKLFLSNVRTNVGLNSPINQCIVTFNTLPSELTETRSFNLFKRKIKQHEYLA